MSTEEAERRSYVRLGPDTDLRCQISGIEVVHVLGLSAGGTGMRVITDKPLPEKSAFGVSLELGEGLGSLRCQGRVVWQESRDFDFCNRHISGVAFDDLQDGDRRRLVSLLPKGET
ncbi:MAG: PilZ domain-containing protein [Candidatus Eremiobacterota bacterium]